MSSKHEKLAERLATILVELNTKGQLDINELAERFSVGVRTLQKDFNERLAFLDWDLKGPRFYSLNRNQFGVFTKEDVERFARFASIQDLFPKLDRELFQRTLINVLSGREVAPMADIPKTDKVDRYQWNDYVLLDTPGVNAPIEHDRVTTEQLSRCSVILFVIRDGDMDSKDVG